MSEEDELLNRTLQRCLREVRKALDADSDVKALATCKARKGWKRLKSDCCSHGPSFSLCLWKLCVQRERRDR